MRREAEGDSVALTEVVSRVSSSIADLEVADVAHESGSRYACRDSAVRFTVSITITGENVGRPHKEVHFSVDLIFPAF